MKELINQKHARGVQYKWNQIDSWKTPKVDKPLDRLAKKKKDLNYLLRSGTRNITTDFMGIQRIFSKNVCQQFR